MGAILVVGGCGFLGHHIVKRLLETHAATDIFVLDIRTDKRLPNISYYEGDISSKSVVQSVFAQTKPRVIFHTASPPAFFHSKDFFMRVNVVGTRNLLESAKEVNTVIAFVYTSSASVPHDSVSDLVNVDESTPVLCLPSQKEAYHCSKAVAESLVLKANCQDGKMMTIAIRPSGLFGEDDLTTVKPIVDAAAQGSYRYQVGNGNNLFDWTYVDNAVDAHILAAQALLKGSNFTTRAPVGETIGGEAFLVTNDEAVPFWEFARAIGAAAGYSTNADEIRVIPWMVAMTIAMIAEWVIWITSFGRRKSSVTRARIRFSTMTRTYRIDKAKRLLGYKPRVSMTEGIRRAGQSFVSKTLKSR